MSAARDKVKLVTLLGNHAGTAALKRGDISSPLVEFDYADVKVPNTQFKPMVREGKYDCGELAIVTFLQARIYGKPYVMLPAAILGRGQHHTIFYNSARGKLGPRDLPGKRVGVRAYTQTTGAWVRGILQEDYGVDVNGITWITTEDPHLAEYQDPPGMVVRVPDDKSIPKMVLEGEVVAAIVGDTLPDPRLKYLVADHEAANKRWAEKNGGVPINHLYVVRQSISQERPDVVREVFRMLVESAKQGVPPGTEMASAIRFGVDACRTSLERIIDYSFRQKLIPRRFTVDELFDDTTRALKP
jgi:4,5-dihydroxyphthalate decarboxylase